MNGKLWADRLEKGIKWAFAIIGSSLVISGFILIFTSQEDELIRAIIGLAYTAAGFECLFFSVVISPLLYQFGRLFAKVLR